jgi:hypothetical protein
MNHERAGTIVAHPYESDRGRHISPSSTIKSRLVAAVDSGLAVRLNAGVSTASTEIFLSFLQKFLLNEEEFAAS